jgi:NADH-quinone oxidoreductase subunit A
VAAAAPDLHDPDTIDPSETQPHRTHPCQAPRRHHASGYEGDAHVLSEYLPILLLFGLATAFAVGSIAVSSLVGPRVPNPTKLGAYESGNKPLADVKNTRFSVKFYMVAMLFLIFDIEAVFVYPWAVVFRELGWFGLGQMVIFIGILGIAFIYEIGRGGLEWD